MLDHKTLFFAATVAIGCVGLLLIVAWLQNRRDRMLLCWSIGYGLFASGLALITLREALPWFVGYPLANAVLVAGYAFNWAGVRVFDGRRILWVLTLGGPLLCGVAYLVPGVAEDYRARAFIVTALAAAYSFVIVVDLLRARGDGLRARPALAATIGVNGSANAVRAGHSLTVAPDFDMLSVSEPVLSITGLVSLLAVVAANLLLMAMSKERVAAAMQRLANTDPLTGAASRGRFFTVAAAMTEAAHTEGKPLSMVVFDLDGFKAVNDGAGHEAGDALLHHFADIVRTALPVNGVFGRIGGEEFAVAIPGDEEEAARFAETVRRRYAATATATVDAAPTVSAGLAALVFGEKAESLVARADKALYAAKAAGRDQVKRAPALNR